VDIANDNNKYLKAKNAVIVKGQRLLGIQENTLLIGHKSNGRVFTEGLNISISVIDKLLYLQQIKSRNDLSKPVGFRHSFCGSADSDAIN
jgi:hypothetical protein